MQASLSRDHTLNVSLLLSHYLAPALEKSVIELSEAAHIQIVIDKSLVDQVNKKNEANRLKAEEALARGQATLKTQKR